MPYTDQPPVPDGWLCPDRGPLGNGDALCSEDCREKAKQRWIEKVDAYTRERAEKIFSVPPIVQP